MKTYNINILQSKKLTFIIRVLLGGTLLVFGTSKLPDLAGFVDTVVRYRVLPEFLAFPYGYALPCIEVVVGLFLIVGLGLRIVAPVAILVIASLIAGTTGSIYLLGIQGPCGCMPGLN